jgi:hypothetical protein
LHTKGRSRIERTKSFLHANRETFLANKPAELDNYFGRIARFSGRPEH